MDYFNIPGFLTTLFGFYVFIYTYNLLTGSKIVITTKTKYTICVFSLIMMLNNLYNVLFLRIPSTIVILILFILVIEKRITFQILLTSVFICLLSVIVEFILSIVVVVVVPDLKSVNRLLVLKNFFTLIYFWIYYFIAKRFVVKYIYYKTCELFKKKKNLILLIFGFFLLTASLYSMYTVNYNNIHLYTLSLLTILIYIIIIFCYLKEIHNNQLLKIKNDFLLERQQLFNSTLEDYRTLRHNLLNDFVFISSICEEKVRKIIKEKIKKYDAKIKYINDITNIPEGLQGLIYFKSTTARKKNVLFYTDNELSLNQHDFNQYKFNKKIYIDLFEIICIILDNAIEAADLSSNKVVYFNIIEKDKNICFVIINTYSNPIDLDNISSKNYSTKGSDRGLGLNYAKFLNKEINIKTSIINNLFKTEISIIKK